MGKYQGIRQFLPDDAPLGDWSVRGNVDCQRRFWSPGGVQTAPARRSGVHLACKSCYRKSFVFSEGSL